MTDPLTGKQLVEKSYEYIEKLTRECAKSLVDEFNSTHKKFDPQTCVNDVGVSITNWFAKRDRNIKLSIESTNIFGQGQPRSASIKFKGSTKDAVFEISALIGTFVVPSVEGKQLSFVKSITFSVEKGQFVRRKF